MEKKANIFQEYRRVVLPDTQSNSFEGVVCGVDALMNQLNRHRRCDVCGGGIWEICLVDWSRMFRIYLN